MTEPPHSPLGTNPEAFVNHSQKPLLRDVQLAELRSCFSGPLALVRPLHAWVHGPPGTGKTLCIRHLLEKEARQAGFLPLYVNCRERFTFLSVIERILDQVKPLRSTQRTKERLVAFLHQELRNRRAVIALDEVDVLTDEEAADLLHHLCAFPTTSVICIASSRHMLLRLPEAVRSRLAPRQVLFPRYQPEELRRILLPVIGRALPPNAWSPEALQVVVDHSYGDARRAIALLRHVIQRAEDAGARTLRPEHLQPSNFNHYDSRVEEQLGELSSHHRVLYDLVVAQGPISRPTLGIEYLTAYRGKEGNQVAPRTIDKYLVQLYLFSGFTLRG